MKHTRQDMIIFSIVFVIIFHGVIYKQMFFDKPFWYHFDLVVLEICILLWIETLHIRLTDMRIRRIMVSMGWLLFFYLFISMGRYVIFKQEKDLIRYFWFLYYVPMNFIPLLFLGLTTCLDEPEDKKLGKPFHVLFVLEVVRTLIILTNDFHELVFVYKLPSVWGQEVISGEYTYTLFAYIGYVFDILLFFIAVGIMLKKCRSKSAMRFRYLPVFVAVPGIALLLLNLAGKMPKFRGTYLWHVPEVYVYIVIAVFESCIMANLIPANVDYKELFSHMTIPARLTDFKGNVFNRSAGVSGKISINRKLSLSGGQFFWEEDMTEISALNERINENVKMINERNSILKNENALKSEQAMIETQNRIYTEIEQRLKPEFDKISLLLEEEDGDVEFSDRLASIAVYQVIIKRMSNMEMIRQNESMMSTKELELAVSETLEYLRLCKVEAWASFVGEYEMPSKLLIYVYSVFCRVVEESLECMSALNCFVRVKSDGLSMRLMLTSDYVHLDDLGYMEKNQEYSSRLSVTKEENDVFVTLELMKKEEVL